MLVFYEKYFVIGKLSLVLSKSFSKYENVENLGLSGISEKNNRELETIFIIPCFRLWNDCLYHTIFFNIKIGYLTMSIVCEWNITI